MASKATDIADLWEAHVSGGPQAVAWRGVLDRKASLGRCACESVARKVASSALALGLQLNQRRGKPKGLER